MIVEVRPYPVINCFCLGEIDALFCKLIDIATQYDRGIIAESRFVGMFYIPPYTSTKCSVPTTIIGAIESIFCLIEESWVLSNLISACKGNARPKDVVVKIIPVPVSQSAGSLILL